MGDIRNAPPRIPVSTYRLQFNQQFTFEQAAAIVGYLRALGISDCYSSPILQAHPGSMHGYDVVDPTKLNPELGGEEQFFRFAHELRQHGMSILMDTVPNHMRIAGSENRWWLDVLQNGPSSPYARFFDIDWNPPNPSLKNKVLLPILGDQYGRVLENQEIKITYRGGAFYANYYETALPIAPRTSTLLLELALRAVRERLGEFHADVLELESIVTALKNLPPRTETDPARVRLRRRETLVSKRRLANLVKRSGEARRATHEAVGEINGRPGEPASFDRLEELLNEQAYRLSYWRVASDEINYRRFFDINELGAVRVEERPVFTAVHEVVLGLMRRGFVAGLRIDHVDGLLDPEKYLHDLQRACRAALSNTGDGDAAQAGEQPFDAQEFAGRNLPAYIVVEKILGHDERLHREWPIHGTTGYEFMNLLNGVFVDTRSEREFFRLYRDFTGATVNFRDLLYECKKLILRVAMSSELHVLARKLERISEQHRWSRDFTLNSLQDALGEVIACFPVYRSYIRRRQTAAHEDDRRHIESAIRAAKRRNPAISQSIYDFIGSLLLWQDPKGLGAAERAARRDFVLRFQQLTSPVMAKGLEDTAFYRFYPLASLNEVGGEPAIFGASPAEFHRVNQERQKSWPHTLSATSTHDTKRSEDVRARLNVLSEMPAEWERAITRWRELNRDKKRELDGAEAPDANEEYLLYQTIVGAWPLAALNEAGHAEFVERIQNYLNKALKEAKVHTSWINPNEEYEQAARDFAGAILARGEENRFLADLSEWQKPVARAGLFNSLSQTLLKIAAPGVPDFYQGTEVWNFSLVDPDNRRPVDYEQRQKMLSALGAESQDLPALACELMRNLEDGRSKLYVTTRALAFRHKQHDLFARGAYIPLRAAGAQADCVLAFARRLGEQEAIALAPRFFVKLGIGESAPAPLGPEVWRDTSLSLPETAARARYRDVFTGREFTTDGPAGLALADILAHLPVALLERS